MTKPVLKAVLFDMDDTLIDWQGWSGDWQSVENRHLRQVYDFLAQAGRGLFAGYDTFREEYARRSRDAWAYARTTLKAPHLGHILMQTLADFGFTPDDRLSADDCLRAYDWETVPGVVTFPDVPPVLRLLLERGIRTGIVTNASQSMAWRDVELAQYDLLQYFPIAAARISAADVGYLKPHESIFQRALAAVSAAPEEAVFVGDNPVADIAGAQSAGMKAVLRVLSPAPGLISGLIVPDAAINSFAELPAILDTWFTW
ncbi:MAG: HAD family hydrolase [Anaerolineae bacterium]|jgi:putative hydrolase of the HAD superfamily|nr:HAD family hydrolase [Anaerolineae bacterium]